VVRATSSGLSELIAPDGRPTISIPVGKSGAATGRVYHRTALTPYMRALYLLPYLCLAISLIIFYNLFTAGWRRWRVARKQQIAGGDHEEAVTVVQDSEDQPQ
jgi:apolipoprotein N-acyltransferase